MRLVILSLPDKYSWRDGIVDALSSDHDVVVFNPDEASCDDIFHECVGSDADAFIWIRTHLHPPQGNVERLIPRLSHNGICTVGVHPDAYWGLGARSDEIGRAVGFWQSDIVFTADDPNHKWEQYGICHRFMPSMVNTAGVLQGRYHPDYDHDVVFIGTGKGYAHSAVWPHRPQLVDYLKTTYGDRFAHYGPGGTHGEARGQLLSDICVSSKIIVSDACAPLGGYIMSDRIPNVTARGAFVLHTRQPGVTDGTLYTEGEHLAAWKAYDWAELHDKIEYYLAHFAARSYMSIRAHLHTLRHHTCRNRARQIINELRGT